MAVRALHKQGHTYAEIGRLIGRDWRTVKRYIEEGAQPVYRRKKPPSKLDAFKPLIESWLEKEPRLRATRIHQDLARDYGFTGSYQIVRRYVEELRTNSSRKAKPEERFETPPGHQAQVDWSHEEPIITAGGLALPLYGFHMVLAHSRETFCRFVGSMDLSTFWACRRALPTGQRLPTSKGFPGRSSTIRSSGGMWANSRVLRGTSSIPRHWHLPTITASG